jgi:tetratricopeptide (TPR) repeat protein
MQHGHQLYDTTLRVPLIFSGLPDVKTGGRVAFPVSLVDLTPTILDCLKVPQPRPTTGRSLKAALLGQGIEPRLCYAETDIPFLENRWAPLRGIVADRWKYIRTTRSELYDLLNDPHEAQNLAESQPATLRELQSAFEEFIGRMVLREAGSVNLTASEQRMLESLGYAGGRSGPDRPDPVEPLPDIKDMLPLFNEAMLARTLLRDGAVEGAIVKLQKVLEQAPDYCQAQLVLGDALLAQQRFDEAVVLYQAVAARRRDFGDAEGRWANALAAQGRFDEALPHYRKVLDIVPEASVYRLQLAAALTHLRRPQEAAAVLDEAIRDNPQDLRAHLELGNLLMQSGRMDMAIPHFEEVLKIQPAEMLARLNLASALAHERRFAGAVAHATKAVEDVPENFEARYTLGAIYLTQSRYPEAIVHLKEACRLRPDDDLSRAQLQRAQKAADREKSAKSR